MRSLQEEEQDDIGDSGRLKSPNEKDDEECIKDE